jgi:Ca2+-binding RTX toxin-like protein
VVDNGNGTYTVTPTSNYSGAMSLLYSVVDGQGGTTAASASLSVTAVNDAPAGSFSGSIPAGTEDTAFTVTRSSLLQGFSDVDGDTLSLSNLSSNHGTVVDNGNGTYTVTPTSNYSGAMSLLYSVVDGQGGSVAGAASVTVNATVAGVTIAGTDRTTGEDGDAAVFAVYLNKAPRETVTLQCTVSDPTEARVTETTLVFTANNWNQPQSLTVTGLDDYDNDGAVPYNLQFAVVTNDIYYKRVAVSSVALTNNDDTWDAPILRYGNNDIDYLLGGNAADRLYGGGNMDELHGARGDDRLYGQEDDDRLYGEDGNDQLYGGYDDDTLDGGVGNDTMEGEAGVDTLIGGDGNDSLNGGTGADWMSGGAGNDTYYVDDVNDVISDGGAASDVDTVVVMATITYRLAANVEDATLSDSAGAAGLTGNSLENDLIGNVGNNKLDGGSGNDTLDGNTGNDSLVGGDGNDFITGGLGTDTLNGGRGIDTADYADASDRVVVNLATGRGTGDGNDRLISIENVSGSNYSDLMTGSSGANTLAGGLGADTLAGGLGADKLTGGTGNDRFVFDTAPGSTNIDTVTDFLKGTDKIVLDDDIFTKLGIGTTTGKVIAAANYKVGTAAGDANDYLIYNPATDKLYYDNDGNGAGAAVQIATITLSGTTAPAYSDFFLVV